MASFFGFEERDAQGFIDRHAVCMPHMAEDDSELHYVVSPFHKDDIVFIKHCDSPSELHIKAVGVLRSQFPRTDRGEVCLPVDWVWQGEKLVVSYEENLPLCGKPLYEEHNIEVQREIIDLMPARYHLMPAR